MKLEKLYERIGSGYRTILERFCNDENMLRKYVLCFPDDPTYENLLAAIKTLDYTGIEHEAHTLKGVSANLGFDKLQDACSDMVLCIRYKEFENIPKKLQKIIQEYETVIKEITMMKESKPAD